MLSVPVRRPNDMEEDKDMSPKASQTMLDDITELLELMKDGEQSLYEW